MRLLTIVALLAAAIAPAAMVGSEAALNVNDGAPTAAGTAKANGINTGNMGAYDPSTAMSALYYSKAAYCAASDISAWSCPACSYHYGMQNVQVVAFDDVQAYVGYNSLHNQIVVAFRGSSNIQNWITDLSFTKVPYAPCGGSCNVHQGFYSAWTGLSPLITPKVNALLASKPSATVFVTGHSLGAAISILAAVDLSVSTQDRNIVLYNFGEPRVGDAGFAAYAVNTLPSGYQYRVTHHRDPVPHVPPKDFGFLHTPHEVFYPGNTNSSYVVCSDSATAEDKKCSDQYLLETEVSDHLLYLGHSTSCSA